MHEATINAEYRNMKSELGLYEEEIIILYLLYIYIVIITDIEAASQSYWFTKYLSVGHRMGGFFSLFLSSGFIITKLDF